MSQEELQHIQNQIAEAREKGLLLDRDTSLIAKGKVMEMDTFSWQNPNIDVLEKTILSFPFSVLWIGNPQEILALTKQANLEKDKIQALIYDNEYDGIDVESALEKVVKMKFKPGILLFTSSNSNSEYNIKKFNEFVELIQLQ